MPDDDAGVERDQAFGIKRLRPEIPVVLVHDEARCVGNAVRIVCRPDRLLQGPIRGRRSHRRWECGERDRGVFVHGPCLSPADRAATAMVMAHRAAHSRCLGAVLDHRRLALVRDESGLRTGPLFAAVRTMAQELHWSHADRLPGVWQYRRGIADGVVCSSKCERVGRRSFYSRCGYCVEPCYRPLSGPKSGHNRSCLKG